MNDPELDKFISIKEDVLNNLSSLQLAVVEFTDEGMNDNNDDLYNLLDALIKQAEMAEVTPDLDVVIIKARDIEMNLDAWLASQGRNSGELSWPDTS
jgi:hypothetical protein